ncbi:MAG TPA: class I SAM-dependent methyltransferase [Pirellulaceae bacterium]|nr:class I SAM-dependent methyltransferase [Pirellulaceae bacterium]
MSAVDPDHLRTIRAVAAGVDDIARQLHLPAPQTVAELDRLIETACAGSDDEGLGSLAVAVGFRLGEMLCRGAGARWVGLREPVPPRIELAGRIASPIELVQRRLETGDPPTLAEAVAALMTASDETFVDRAMAIERNRIAWDRLSNDPRFAAETIPELTREQAVAGLDPWLRDERLDGKRLLLLGGAGGTHAALYAMAGAIVTVVDLSPSQLERDRSQADRLGISLRSFVASADALTMIESESIDIVVQPVLTSYLPDVTTAYREVHRVLRTGGSYVSQHKMPEALRAVWNPQRERYELDRRTVLPSIGDEGKGTISPLREPETIEFAHSLGTLLGELCRVGFVIEGFHEPLRSDVWAPCGSIAHLADTLPPYCRIKARRLGCAAQTPTAMAHRRIT